MTTIDRRAFLESAAAVAAATALRPRSAGAAGGMKKAVYVSMLPEELGYRERFQLALDVGFEGIEIGTITDPAVATEIKEAAAKTGLKIHSVMNADHWKYPLSSADPEVVTKSVAGMEQSLRNAKLWGADSVLLVPAVVNPETSYKDAWTRSQRVIKERILPLAQELKVVIGMEEVWNKFLLSPLEMARYVDEFASPWVKAYLDVGNVLFYGYPQDWVRTLGPRICRVHIKDFKLDRQEGRFSWKNLGEGDVDWPEVRKAFSEIGYDGWITTEIERRRRGLPEGRGRALRPLPGRPEAVRGLMCASRGALLEPGRGIRLQAPVMIPPSTVRAVPVTQSESLEARKRAARATSSGWPRRFRTSPLADVGHGLRRVRERGRGLPDERRVYRAGAQQVDPDLRPVVDRDLTDESDERALGRAIGHVVREPLEGGDRPDDHDRSPAAPLERRQDGAQQVEDGVQVHGERLPPRLDGNLGRGAEAEHPRTAHGRVHSAERAPALGHQALIRLGQAHVAGHELGPAPAGADLADEARAPLHVAAAGQHAGPLAREQQSRGAAHSARRTGDERRLPLQLAHRGAPPPRTGPGPAGSAGRRGNTVIRNSVLP